MLSDVSLGNNGQLFTVEVVEQGTDWPYRRVVERHTVVSFQVTAAAGFSLPTLDRKTAEGEIESATQSKEHSVTFRCTF